MSIQPEEFLNALDIDPSSKAIIVLPGDHINTLVKKFDSQAKIGGGLFKSGNDVIAKCGGVLKQKPNYSIESHRKRYEPVTGDQVVGIIEDRGGDYYKLNIFSGASALLHRLGFEGATKRNKPELKIGDVVYCRVSLAHIDLDTEVTCTTTSGIKKEWSSGETIYGELKEGILLRVSLEYCKRLLSPNCAVLNCLGKYIAYEVCIGMNGAVWIKSGSVKETIAIRIAIIKAEGLSDLHVEALVDILVGKMKNK